MKILIKEILVRDPHLKKTAKVGAVSKRRVEEKTNAHETLWGQDTSPNELASNGPASRQVDV